MTTTPPRAELVPADGRPGIELSAGAQERIRQSVPDNTRRAYARQLDRFTAWCDGHGVAALPAEAATLTEYVNHLADLDQAPASIEQAIAAIRTAHRVSGYTGLPDTEGARRVLRTHRRERAEKGQGRRQAPPVTLDPLRAMVTAVDPATLAGRRDRALLGDRCLMRHWPGLSQHSECCDDPWNPPTFGPAGQGLTSTVLHDITGPVGHAQQILTVRPGTA
ncbi:site-specific integrase [Streptomyces sp. MK5]|uniref:site-specific integrase n=1 Tax=Streptomyces sp. MK5 TaxID=3064253 RepID=UPI0027412D04|nr:site-specific integrase [Streptomyces sp. MK5]